MNIIQFTINITPRVGVRQERKEEVGLKEIMGEDCANVRPPHGNAGGPGGLCQDRE